MALDKQWTRWCDFVTRNPQVASEIENSLRWLSYLTTAGRWKNAQLISECLYSASNLLQLVNDAILRKANNIKLHVNESVERLQTFLAVLEFVQVFSEFSATRVAGDVGRWIIIASIQISKAVIRMILLLKYKQGIQKSQAIMPLDRIRGLKDPRCQEGPPIVDPTCTVKEINDDSEESDVSKEPESFTLKNSGRVIRTIDQAPPRNLRLWNPPGGKGLCNGSTIQTVSLQEFLEKNKRDAPPSALDDNQTLGEILHILRPLAHLAGMGVFGEKSWAPYLVSLGMDCTSLKLLSEPSNKLWNVSERIELGQRSFSLVLYLLRSPFYDKYTKQRILTTLRFLSDHIPIFGRLIRPLIDYLPEWQRVYFYVWSV